jgi:(2Fe-2S) ferredoxin
MPNGEFRTAKEREVRTSATADSHNSDFGVLSSFGSRHSTFVPVRSRDSTDGPAMPRFVRHVFVCCNQREAGHPRGCCAAKGGEDVRAAFKLELKKAGVEAALGGPVRANMAGCLDQCEHGITVAVYPEGVFYGGVTVADVAQIVADHILGGRPVDRLLLSAECLNAKTCPHKPTPAGAKPA